MLFFVISGFLLYRPYALAHRTGGTRPSWRAMRGAGAADRPGVLDGTHCAGAVSGGRRCVHRRVVALLLVPAGLFEAHGASGIPIAWSLSVEVSFYIALPMWALRSAALARLAGRSWLSSELAGLAVLAVIGVGVQIAASRLLVSDLLATDAAR